MVINVLNYLSLKKKFQFAILRPMFHSTWLHSVAFLAQKIGATFADSLPSERGANFLSKAVNYERKFRWLEAQDLKLCHSIARNVTAGRHPTKFFRALISRLDKR